MKQGASRPSLFRNDRWEWAPDDPDPSFEDAFSRLIPAGELIPSGLPRAALFCGEGMGAFSSYLAGWMVWRGIDVILLDGTNRFDPYRVSSLARRVGTPPEALLKRIRIARAFTCHQMATLITEKLAPFSRGMKRVPTPFPTASPRRGAEEKGRPWIALLGPVTPFLDEDVSGKEARPLFERSLQKLRELAEEGTPFLIFQAPVPSTSNRGDLMKRLADFSSLVWRVSPGEEGTRFLLEKGPAGAGLKGGRTGMDRLATFGPGGHESRPGQTGCGG